MFGRGNWAILGLAKESLDAFKTNLEDRSRMIAVSQLAASAITRHLNTDTLGLNPFSCPRLDEQQAMPVDQESLLVQYATLEQEKRSDAALPPEVVQHEGYAFGLEQFQLHDTLPWFGLWSVANQWKDISDLASIREQHAYSVFDRPYKFLQATDKKTVDKDTRGATAAVRKQFAVLLDFASSVPRSSQSAGISIAPIGLQPSLAIYMKAATTLTISKNAPTKPHASVQRKLKSWKTAKSRR
jgi:hypothetical protein